MSLIHKVKTLAFAEGVTILISFLLLPYLSRSLSIVDYGTYGQVILLVDIFKSISILGLNKIIFAYVEDNENSKSVLFFNNLYASFVVGIIFAFFCLISIPIISNYFQNENIYFGASIYCLSIPFQSASLCLGSIFVLKNKVNVLRNTTLFINIFRYFGTFLILSFGFSFHYIFIVFLFSYLLQFFILLYYSEINLNFQQRNNSLIINQIRFGLPLGFTTILGTLYYYIDSFLVSSFLNVEQFAIFRNGCFQLPFLVSIYSIISMVIMPDLGNYYIKGHHKLLVNFQSKISFLTSVFLYPSLCHLMVNANLFYLVVFNGKYQDSVPIFIIYNLILFFRITSYDNILVIAKKTRLLPRIYMISILVNILLGIFLTKNFGGIGAVIATVISFSVLIFLLLKETFFVLKTNIIEYFKLNDIFRVLIISLTFSVFSSLVIYIFNISNYFSIVLIAISTILNYHFFMKGNFIEPIIKLKIINGLGLNSFLKSKLLKFYC